MLFRSFKKRIVLFTGLGYVCLWSFFFVLTSYQFKKDIEQSIEFQTQWLSFFSSTFLSDLRTGNFLLIKKKLSTLVRNNVFVEATLQSGDIRLVVTEENNAPTTPQNISLITRVLDRALVPTHVLSLEIVDDQQTRWGKLTAMMDINFLIAPVEKKMLLFARVGLALFFLLFGLLILLFKYQLKPLGELTEYMRQFSKSRHTPQDLKRLLEQELTYSTVEWKLLASGFKTSLRNMLMLQEEVRQKTVESELAKVAIQVAHDIRSPLSVISMLSSIPDVEPNPKHRHMLDAAVNQIRGIANDLLCRYRSRREPNSKEKQFTADITEPQLMACEIHNVLGSLRFKYAEQKGIVIMSKIPASLCWVFAKVDATCFQRVITNLVENAVEAAEEKGEVRISLTAPTRELVCISITDTGKGIPANVLSRIKTQGGTYDKANGNGLGLKHAFESVRAWGGRLDIQSSVGKGTTVQFQIPGCEPPRWLPQAIAVQKKGNVLIVDDDTKVKTLWEERFKQVGVETQLNALSCENAEAATQWVMEHQFEVPTTTFLVDYLLGKNGQNGLELVKKLSLEGRSVLVTALDNDVELRNFALAMRVPLLPKNYLEFVPVRVRT